MRSRKISYFTIIIVLSVFLLSACAGQMKLVTPPLYLRNANYLYCTAVNLHDNPVTVDINVLDQEGNKRCGAGPWELDPGHTVFQICNSDISTELEPVRYCIFTYQGEKNKVVGSAQINPPDGSAIPAIAVP